MSSPDSAEFANLGQMFTEQEAESIANMMECSLFPMILKNYGIMDDEEIRKLNVSRSIFVKQIKYGDICVDRYLQQIREESKLLDLCYAEIIERRYMKEDDKYNIITNICNRINNLYSIMFNHYPVTGSIIKSYMIFALSYEEFNTVYSNLLSKILNKKHKDLGVYIMAAEIIYNKTANVHKSREMVALGLKHYSDSTRLKISDFWLETQLLHENDGESLPIALTMYKDLLKKAGGYIKYDMILLKFITRFNESGELQLNVLNDMVNLHGMDEQMWRNLGIVYLNSLINDNDTKCLNNDRRCERRNVEYDNHSMTQKELYKECLRSLGYNDLAWPMWEFIMNWRIKNNIDHKTVIKFYELGIKHPKSEISERLQCEYLSWTISNKGIHPTRKLFMDLKKTTGLELYKQMIQIEKNEPENEPKISRIIKLYYEACKMFGRGNLRIWKDTIQYTYVNGRYTEVDQIFECSSSYLETELIDELKNELELIKDEYDGRHVIIECSIDITDEDDSPPDYQRKNNCSPTVKDNCSTKSTTDNCFSESTITCPHLPAEKNKSMQPNMDESTKPERDINSNFIDITNEDDSPPDHQRKNNCPLTSRENNLLGSTDTCPLVSTKKNKFRELEMHKDAKRRCMLNMLKPDQIVILDDDDSAKNRPMSESDVIVISDDDDDDSPPDHQRKNNQHKKAEQIDECLSPGVEIVKIMDKLQNKIELQMDAYLKRHCIKNLNSTDEDNSPPGNQRIDNCPPTSKVDNCPPSTSTQNFPTKSADTSPPVSAENK